MTATAMANERAAPWKSTVAAMKHSARKSIVIT